MLNDTFVYRRGQTSTYHRQPKGKSESPPKEEEPLVTIAEDEDDESWREHPPNAPRILPIPLKSPPPVLTNLKQIPSRLPVYYDSDLTSPDSASSSRGFSIDSGGSVQSSDRDPHDTGLGLRNFQGRSTFNRPDQPRAPPAKGDRHQHKDGRSGMPAGISPMLQKGSSDLITWDLRMPVEHVRRHGRSLSANELRQPAFYPPTDSITVVITIRDIPNWPIYVVRTGKFVTVENILNSVYESLLFDDCKSAWHQDKAKSSSRERIMKAYNRRCEALRSVGGSVGGLARSEWLGSKIMFFGFSPVPGSTPNPQRWIMDTDAP